MLNDFFAGDGFLQIVLRVAATLLITLAATKLVHMRWGRFEKDTIHRKFTKNVLSVIIGLTGIIFSLRWIPQFADAAPALLAGSGFVALAIGLAAQESLGNAFNGLFISIFKPFEVGDRIHLVHANITGFVEDITIRHTVIRTFLNSRIIIPNSIISKEMIENSNFCNQRASSFIDVIIRYDSNVERACHIIAEVIGNHIDFIDTRTPEQLETTPKVPVFVRGLGLHGIELRASMWTETVANNFAAASEVRLRILHEFQSNNIDIAVIAFPNSFVRL
ncbi:MAG: mechanosensitive ion channel family protein [Turicibacter sp.]|nr:mechanosensitive ion channel family protein [Turicibacter sp.]